MKHIESIQPEYAAGDLSRLLVSEADATASAALSRLLHDWTGCDIPPTADHPQSEVEELVPLCLSILRRHWQTPLTALGDGNTPMSLADLLRRLIGDRVQGNEAWSIPPANADIPTAVAALRQRDMSSGIPDAPDGISLVQLLCGVSHDGTDIASTITEIVDSNRGWKWTRGWNMSSFSNLKFLSFGCSEVYTTISSDQNALLMNVSADVVEFPLLESIKRASPHHSIIIWGNMRVISLPKLKYGQLLNNTDCGAFRGENLEEILMPSIEEIPAEAQYSLCTPSPKLRKVVFGKMKSFPQIRFLRRQITGADDTCPELVHIEFGEGTACNIDLRNWLAGWTTTPTALSERLPEFLQNFKTYIANRLTDKGSGLTLTLSQAVRDAIQQDPEIVSIITSKGWTISPAPSV